MLRLLLFLTFTLPLLAQETMIREVADPATDTHVEILALFSKPTLGGYLPVRVKIANNLKDDRSIRVGFQSTYNYSENLHSESSFDFTAGAGKTVTRDIMVPIVPSGEAYGQCTISATLSGSLGRASNSISSESVPGQPAVLLSESLFTPYASTLDSEMNSRLGGSRGSSEFATKFDPKQLPDEWLAFSGYDSVMMTDADWTNVPPGGRNAILSWVRLGGQLNIYQQSGSATSQSLGLPEEAGFGTIAIRRQKLSVSPATAKMMLDDVLANPIATQQSSLHSDYSGSWPLQSHFGAQTFRYALFVGVLILFGIVVGPVNLFVFAKAGQRHKLFITTPVISLAASLLLVGLIIVQDGFGGSGVRLVLMEVRPDDGLNAAYLHQEQFCRTGVLTGTGFTIPTPAAIAPTPIARSRWARFTRGYSSKGNFNLQPADGKIAAGGDWFQSRSEHGNILTSVVSTRGRIESTGSPGIYLSTFEFPIDTIYFLDPSNQWQRASHIEAGKRFSLTPVDATMVDPELEKVAKSFAKRNRDFFRITKDRPGHFIALTDQAPGIETNPAIRWKETRTVITGPVVAP